MKVRDQINPEAFVAGGVHPWGTEADEFRERVRLLAENDVDLIFAEAVNTIDGCVSVAEACADFELPLFLGIGNLSEDGSLFDGSTFESLVLSLREYRVDGLMAMDSFPPSISAALPHIKESVFGIFWCVSTLWPGRY